MDTILNEKKPKEKRKKRKKMEEEGREEKRSWKHSRDTVVFPWQSLMFRVRTKRDVNQLAKRMVNAEKRKHEWPLTFGTQPSLSSSTRGGGTCFQNSMKGIRERIGRETRRELRFARKIYELPCGNGMKLS